MFKFPQVMVIKGGYELIHINMSTAQYTYFQLPAYAGMIGCHNSDEFSFDLILDLGDFYGKMSISAQ